MLYWTSLHVTVSLMPFVPLEWWMIMKKQIFKTEKDWTRATLPAFILVWYGDILFFNPTTTMWKHHLSMAIEQAVLWGPSQVHESSANFAGWWEIWKTIQRQKTLNNIERSQQNIEDQEIKAKHESRKYETIRNKGPDNLMMHRWNQNSDNTKIKIKHINILFQCWIKHVQHFYATISWFLCFDLVFLEMLYLTSWQCALEWPTLVLWGRRYVRRITKTNPSTSLPALQHPCKMKPSITIYGHSVELLHLSHSYSQCISSLKRIICQKSLAKILGCWAICDAASLAPKCTHVLPSYT